MDISQKAKVVIQYLVPVSVGYFALAIFITRGSPLSYADINPLANAAALLSVAAALVQDLVPKPLKEFAVFWRFRERLPGHRAFSHEIESTHRFDVNRILNWNELKNLVSTNQQKIFYRVYKKHRDIPAVYHYSFRYLAWRDTGSMLLILAIVTMALSSFKIVQIGAIPALKISTTCLCFWLLTVLAARQASKELIVQVLCAESMEDPHVIS